jgi:hypothetical protein
LKRWAAWLRGNRWLAGIAAVVLGLAIAWVLFVPVADWLADHDVGSVRGSLHETAIDNARGRLLTLAAGVFAAGALAFTARNFTLSRRTLDVTEQGQVTDRYAKAIEQLGSDKLDVRIGGIYALERVARDSARAHLDLAILTGAILDGANLTSAMLNLADLTGADLTGVRWPNDAPVPEGWKPDTGTGRLVAAESGAETTEEPPEKG